MNIHPIMPADSSHRCVNLANLRGSGPLTMKSASITQNTYRLLRDT